MYDVRFPFVRSVLYGIGAFVAVSAAVAVGFVFAITGPPNAAEFEELAAIFAGDSDEEDLSTAEVTAQTPSVADTRSAPPEFAPGGVILIQPPPYDPQGREFAEAEAAPSPSAGTIDAVQTAPERAELFGPLERPRARTEAPRTVERATTGRRAERAPPARQRANTRRPARPPLEVARVDAHAPLPSAQAHDLEDLSQAAVPQIASDDELADADMRPTQDEAPPVRAYEDAGDPDDSEMYEADYDDRPWYGSEDYQQEVEQRRAEREARRRDRAERRRAYREWRRRYEGW